ncbi:MAG TPA: DUF2155 domain-containing protein [Stellaceae bacterium]|nr:DUF2155 domain-containing protein [Stellaceae bacterium]
MAKSMRRCGRSLALLSAVILPLAAQAQTAKITGAVLRGLDKTTARITTFTAPLGEPVKFGTLEVTVRDCRKHPPEDAPESAAYLDITESHPGDTAPRHWFSGWMFATSPALSALEHPVYDLWVLDCSTASGPSDKSG